MLAMCRSPASNHIWQHSIHQIRIYYATAGEMIQTVSSLMTAGPRTDLVPWPGTTVSGASPTGTAGRVIKKPTGRKSASSAGRQVLRLGTCWVALHHPSSYDEPSVPQEKIGGLPLLPTQPSTVLTLTSYAVLHVARPAKAKEGPTARWCHRTCTTFRYC